LLCICRREVFVLFFFFFFSSRRRHTRFKCDWSSDVCSSDLPPRRLERPILFLQGLEGPAFGPERFAGLPIEFVELFGNGGQAQRSEERRVGKECRCRWWRYSEKKKEEDARNEYVYD